MAIRHHLPSSSAFSPEDTRELSQAFEEVCRALRIGSDATRAREAVAVRIIELASDGERNAERLRAHLMRELEEGSPLAATLSAATSSGEAAR
jgi:hypothetical protein